MDQAASKHQIPSGMPSLMGTKAARSPQVSPAPAPSTSGVRQVAPAGSFSPSFAPRPAALLADVRARMDALQRGSLAGRPHALSADYAPDINRVSSVASRADETSSWSFGDARLDALLPRGGLDPRGLHEVKPAGPQDMVSAFALTIGLAVRRLVSLKPQRGTTRPILLCVSSQFTREYGAPYGPGLQQLGLDPGRLIVVEPRREADVLWAMEEGLRSSALALVIGIGRQVGLGPARRLVLAAASAGMPGLLLTAHNTEGAPAAHTRWRATAAGSAPHPFADKAPGGLRLELALERCRGLEGAGDLTSAVEWCDEAFRFRMVARLVDRPAAA